MIEWILCGLMLAWGASLAGIAWILRRAMTGALVPSAPVAGGRVAVIMPVAGMTKAVDASIHSLLRQAHPHCEVIFVVGDAEDPAKVTLQTAIRGNAAAKFVLAGQATQCGQKNHNLLAGLTAISGHPDVLVFADAGHGFPDGWLNHLAAPIIRGEVEVTSGYHAVKPANDAFVLWAYAACVEMIHVFQNVPGLSQPWGGAMALSRDMFERLNVAEAWRTSVVDDVSLARILKANGVRVRTLPLVRRETPAVALTLRDLFEWLVRQLQYVRFIFPGTWAMVGAWSFLQVFALCSAAVLVMAGMLGLASVLSAAASGLYLGLIAAVLLQLRRLHPLPCPPIRWLAAGAVFLLVFGAALVPAGLRREIRWRGIAYLVGRGGRVIAVRRADSG